jgi:hypothetical protein
VRGRVGRREQLGLAFQLLGDAEALEQSLKVDPRRPLLDIANRFGIEQRTLERCGRADVGLRRAAFDRKARVRSRNVGAGCCHQLALLDQVVGDRRAEDRDIECRALFYLGLERDSRIEGERELVPGRLLELRGELF